ncbi:hypothetical protein B0H16DRAFT_1643051 [Mycena metata]|uniref:Uncharacterized protein n=1 Tax=Mycena metata TaxID=1033252 RepID=A0AAD7DVW6_9AGAR|nr:hypothetical protein B0H16DRAFT_1643051 [Mycena metata]
MNGMGSASGKRPPTRCWQDCRLCRRIYCIPMGARRMEEGPPIRRRRIILRCRFCRHYHQLAFCFIQLACALQLRTTPMPEHAPPADTTPTPPPRERTTQPPPRCAPTPTRTRTPCMQGPTRMGRRRILVMAATPPPPHTPTRPQPDTPTPTHTPNPPASSRRAAPSPAPRHRAAWTRWRSCGC